ncbi:MAG: hypothetical protein KDB00_19675 [Planctomycetales bacterium]|nr:hypothetical protein [Planctomycetales bacterium]
MDGEVVAVIRMVAPTSSAIVSRTCGNIMGSFAWLSQPDVFDSQNQNRTIETSNTIVIQVSTNPEIPNVAERDLSFVDGEIRRPSRCTSFGILIFRCWSKFQPNAPGNEISQKRQQQRGAVNE